MRYGRFEQRHRLGPERVGLAVELDNADVVLEPEKTRGGVFLDGRQRATFFTKTSDTGSPAQRAVAAVGQQVLQ